jgi:hypothetical protein
MQQFNYRSTPQAKALYWRLKIIFDKNGPYGILLSHMDDISLDSTQRLTHMYPLIANLSSTCDDSVAHNGYHSECFNRCQRENQSERWLPILSFTVKDHQSRGNYDGAWIAARQYQRVYNHYQLVTPAHVHFQRPTSLLHELLQERMNVDAQPILSVNHSHEFDFKCITCHKFGIFQPSGETPSTGEWNHCRRCSFAWTCSYLCRQTHFNESCHCTLVSEKSSMRSSMMSSSSSSIML